MEYIKYDPDNNQISQIKFDRNVTGKSESIFSLGNGYLGIRSVDEEVQEYNKEDFFVNGIFNRTSKEEAPELANLADLIQTPIVFNNQIFEVNEKDQYTKTLDIKNGILSRKVIAKRDFGTVELNFERFVSQDIRNIYAQKITIKILDSKDEIVKVKLLPGINGQVTNNGTQHFEEGLKNRVTTESLKMQQITTNSNRFVVHHMFTRLLKNNKLILGGNDKYQIQTDRRKVYFKIENELKANEELVLEKLMSVHTSIDDEEKILTNSEVLAKSDLTFSYLLKNTFASLKENSTVAMQKVWNQFYVKIEGDEQSKYDALALKFSIFHLNNFVPKNSTNLNVGAKGLSGEGYQGHTYWDTEFFINPNYLFTRPGVVKRLLTYRYKGIKEARNKAFETKQRNEESRLLGAQYPWEMAWPTDGEVCPYWGQTDVVTGEQVPIASRRQEIHVSADIAYAVYQYYHFTNDEEFMKKMGYEMIIDTAYFYTNRAEIQPDGSYEIKDVMGPNEYKGNINNNAFINQMALFNMKLAISVYRKLQVQAPGLLNRILKRIPYKINFLKMTKVIKGLKIQVPNKDKIIAENDTFLSLPLKNVKPFQMLGDAGKKLFNTSEGHRLLGSQLVKQADVVLLNYLFPKLYNKEIREKNFDYYEAITTHDSSLSAATYCIEAVRLNKIEKAYELFKYGINVDFGPRMHTSNAGIHAGSLAAIWQMIVFGFGGLGWFDKKLHITPKLPKNWNSLVYKVSYKNEPFLVEINKDKFTINTINKGSKLKISVNGIDCEITNEKQVFEVKND
ncbi:glycoside hydrolase family 65 protein [Mycoplasmopsis caviae]|uniref:Glycoside hydrolase family 65 protein n=1 Tax=Mycoplasmopsis caviae TaxID=55603 RepID=A0A3P8KLK2_9BACT|nr:glycosyl hydrolase family 65 protein [Mycoplasmopsis caviae]UUD35631.1 glycoside hydrolase family 65 protein [Mycoplasmopsis caviae]VDR41618.1 maltose phosphorylase domain-containing protein [Mycoplasmopsis caviae]